jgi:hypothetical protein
MVRPSLVRFLGAPVFALAAALLLAPGAVMAATPPVVADSPPDCAVTVDPPSAVGGTVFTFTGSGFLPTKLLLQKGDGSPISNDIAPQGDPWTQTVQSAVGDEGGWTATFVQADGDTVGCAIAVHFDVTLTATDVISDLLSDQPQSSLPALFMVMLTGFGLVGGVFLSRRLGAARTGYGAAGPGFRR